MVERRLNVAVGKYGRGKSAFWMCQVLSSEWICRGCGKPQPQLSVAFEMWVKTHSNGAEQVGGKTYLCLECAANLFDEVREKIEIVRTHGVTAFKMMEGL